MQNTEGRASALLLRLRARDETSFRGRMIELVATSVHPLCCRTVSRNRSGGKGIEEIEIADETKQRYAPLQRERRSEKRLARCHGVATSLFTPPPIGSLHLRQEKANSPFC